MKRDILSFQDIVYITIWSNEMYSNCLAWNLWKQVDILISKNQALQILYLKHHV